MNELIKKTCSVARISRINENYIYYILGVSKKKGDLRFEVFRGFKLKKFRRLTPNKI